MKSLTVLHSLRSHSYKGEEASLNFLVNLHFKTFDRFLKPYWRDFREMGWKFLKFKALSPAEFQDLSHRYLPGSQSKAKIIYARTTELTQK